MKNTIKIFTILSTILLLSGCSSTKTKKESNESKNKDISVKVIEGSYFYGEDQGNSDDDGLLALKISIKNNSKKSMSVLDSGISLYDKDGNKVESQNVYSTDKSFKMLTYSKLSPDKTITGYLLFDVKKDAKYELQVDTSNSEDENETVAISLDISKYKDYSDTRKNMADLFIQTVFLNSDKNEKGLELGNDLAKEHNEFKQKFMEALKKEFNYYEPSSAELEAVANKVMEINQKKAKIDYTVVDLTPNYAKIKVNPQIVRFEEIDQQSILDNFVEENQDSYSEADSYEQINQDAEKYLIQHLPEKLSEANVETPEYLSDDGYDLLLNKKGSNWEVDTSNSSNNYFYKNLKKAFMGDLDA